MKSWNWDRQKFLQSDNLDSSWFSKSFFCKKLPWVPSSISQSLVFNFCCIISIKNVTAHPFSGILSDQKWQSAVGPNMPRNLISYFFSSTSFIFPSTCQSLAFYWKQTVDSKKPWILSFTSDLESWLTKCGKRSISLELPWYSKSTFSKTILNSFIEVWFDSDFFLNDSSMEQILTVSIRLQGWLAEHTKSSINVVSMSIFKLISNTFILSTTIRWKCLINSSVLARKVPMSNKLTNCSQRSAFHSVTYS